MYPRRTACWLAIAAILAGCSPRAAAPAPAPAPAGTAVATPSAGPERPTVVVLVRHAEKAADPADNPPLTADGRARAEALVATLRDAGVEAVVVTERRRTHETAGPLVRARGIVPDIVRLGPTVPDHATAVARHVRERHRGRTVLVVGHSNTIPAIVAALGGPRLPDICDAVHSTLFVMIMPRDGEPRMIQSRYGAPDPRPLEGCPTIPAR